MGVRKGLREGGVLLRGRGFTAGTRIFADLNDEYRGYYNFNYNCN